MGGGGGDGKQNAAQPVLEPGIHVIFRPLPSFRYVSDTPL